MDINNMLKDPNGQLPDDSYVEEAKFRALTEHKRKESMLKSLEYDMKQHFKDEFAKELAQEAYKEMRGDDKKPVTALEQTKFDDDTVVAISNSKNEVEVFKTKEGRELSKRKLENVIQRAQEKHKRRKSIMNSIKQDLGEFFDNDESDYVAKHLVDGIVNTESRDSVELTGDQLNDINSMNNTDNTNNDKKTGIRVEKRFNPTQNTTVAVITNNDNKSMNVTLKNGMRHEDLEEKLDEIVSKVKQQHKRKISTFQAMKKETLDLFGDEDSSKLVTSHIMKGFEKDDNKQDKRRESVNLDGSQFIQNQELRELQDKVDKLTKLIKERDLEIIELTDTNEELKKSKISLIKNCMSTIDTLRDYLTQIGKRS